MAYETKPGANRVTAITKAIRTKSGITSDEIATATGIPRSTVNKILRELVGRNVVCDSGQRLTKGMPYKEYSIVKKPIVPRDEILCILMGVSDEKRALP